jgi:hypothetical protein
MLEAIIVIAAVLYLLFHHHHYRAHRRAGLTVRESLPGPWRTWFTVSRRFRLRHLVFGAAAVIAVAFVAGVALGHVR